MNKFVDVDISKTGNALQKFDLLKIVNGVITALCAVLSLIIALNLFLVIKNLILPDNPASLLGYSPLIVKSESMSPEINSGDMIFVQNISDNNFHKGDIISFKTDGAIITHRIIRVTSSPAGPVIYRTKGDNNTIEDGKNISQNEIVGIYRGKIAGLGSFAIFWQSAYGITLLFILSVAWIIFFFVFGRRKIVHKTQP